MKIEKHKCPVCLEFVDCEILTEHGEGSWGSRIKYMRPTKHLDCLGRRCPKRGPRGIYPVPGTY